MHFRFSQKFLKLVFFPIPKSEYPNMLLFFAGKTCKLFIRWRCHTQTKTPLELMQVNKGTSEMYYEMKIKRQF